MRDSTRCNAQHGVTVAAAQNRTQVQATGGAAAEGIGRGEGGPLVLPPCPHPRGCGRHGSGRRGHDGGPAGPTGDQRRRDGADGGEAGSGDGRVDDCQADSGAE